MKIKTLCTIKTVTSGWTACNAAVSDAARQHIEHHVAEEITLSDSLWTAIILGPIQFGGAGRIPGGPLREVWGLAQTEHCLTYTFILSVWKQNVNRTWLLVMTLRVIKMCI